jgi:translocation and assembly module TamB
MSDLYALAEADTTGIGGVLSARVHLDGTAASPRIQAAASLVEGRFGDFRAPLVEGSADYIGHRLAFRGGLWRDQQQVVTVSGSLPLDLALTSVEQRELPDTLEIRLRADSVDLAVLDALTSLVRNVAGQLTANVAVRGTWRQPELSGAARITDGAAGIPALGARYSGIEARLSLSGNRLAVETARLKGGAGTMDVEGEVRFESLTRPVLDLTLTARGFAAFTQRDFAGLTGSGTLQLKGPLVGATLSGRLVVDAGFLAFADLVEKRIVNLDDPEFRAVVDSNLASATGLGPSAPNIFLDSLRIQGLTVSMGPDVWLRSHEANIQLAGDFTVAKNVEGGASRYRLDGTLRAVRGTYRLVVGPTAKEFRVTRGTVRFFGTPDFNPDLDIVAEHSVHAVQGSDVVVRAIIGGTLLVPRLTLESDQRPPLSETEIVSYLLFGRPSFDLASGAGAPGSEQAIFQGALVGLAGVLSGELEQTLVTDLGIPVDYLAIRPGGGSVGDIFGSARVEAGTQIGERTFLTLNAGLCQKVRWSQALGASVEYRLAPRWTLEASIEPTAQECRPVGFQIAPPAPYQVGMDLFWQWGVP